MYVARILYPVEVLGPGKRVGIWFCGCPHRCPGCCNPELWEFQSRYRTTPERIAALVAQLAREHPIDGFTITGGDPMYQAEALQQLLRLLRPISDDILVYTGYLRQQLDSRMLEHISVLIDGPYREALNDDSLLRGSSNQRIHILDPGKEARYRAYLQTHHNQIQNFVTADGIVSVGIHKPGNRAETEDQP